MIVECPGCTTIFPVDPKKIPAGGVNARCSKCGDVFFVAEPEKEAEPIDPVGTDTPVEARTATAAAGVAEEPGGEAAEAEEDDALTEPEEEEQEGVGSSAVEGDLETEDATADDGPGGFQENVAAVEEAASEPMADVGATVEEAEGPMPTFGKRDPMEKAKRLARVLVSDIILYNPDRHDDATESGRVKEEFEEEIQKSWNEYVEQVGDEVANSTSFFNDALNEILAKGDKIF